LGSDRWRGQNGAILMGFFSESFRGFFRPLLELADRLSQTAPHFGQFTGSEKQERCYDDDQNVNGLDSEWHNNHLY
jgi:hypothetical protein